MNTNKRDGALIAQNVDWKNANQKPIDAEKSQLNSGNLDSKDRKYQNLQSSVFGGGYVEEAPIEVDRDVKKAAFTSSADWKDQAAKSGLSNGVGT
jgi:hypothetical protein